MMRRCNKILASFISISIILISAVSCNKEIDFGFKDLCFYHPHTAPVQVGVDWSMFSHIEKPSGMTVYVWSEDPDKENYTFLTHNLNAITLDLEAGNYNAFVFNQSAPEYATIEFHNLEDYDRAEARVMQVKSNWYFTKLPETKVGSVPEWLAIDCVEDIQVTDEMVSIAEKEHIAELFGDNSIHGRSGEVTRSQNHIGTLIPKSVVKNLNIFIHLENAIYLRSGIAAIEGLAEGCYIASGQNTEGRVTHTLETWKFINEKDENGDIMIMSGALNASLSTFGLPAGHTGNPDDTFMHVKLLLVDNTTLLEQRFSIGEIIKDLNSYDGTQFDADGNVIWPELHVYWPEPLPEVEPVGGADGAFDVGVGDWGDEIVTELPLL